MKQLHTYFSRFTFAFVLSLIVGLSASAQTYPVQTTVSTTAPYLNYLSYYGDQNNHLQIMVTNLDFNAPPLLVRLRIRIEGPGYELYTNPNAVIGQPFMLDAGMPLVISGIELLPYLQQNNLINPSNVDLNDLPHGFTTICVDVINESSQQQVLSTNNCGFIPIQEYQPPQAFVPSCGDQLDTNTMFHNFTWTPPVPFPAGAGLDLFYDFSIYHWIDPNNNSALGGNSILVYQENDLIAPTTQISDFDIQWEMGGTYIWTVTARVESNGMPISLIENVGVSAPCTFVYGEELTLADQLADGLEIELFTEPSAERKGKAWWTVVDNTPNQGLSTFDEFFIEYRKQPTGNEGFQIPWFSKTLTSFEHFIYQLEPSTTYEVKVSGVIAGVVGDPTPVKTFTTPDPRVYNCGDADLPYLPSTYTPLENATVGIEVQIGQFYMKVTELVELGGGHYSGKGTIPIAFLGGAKAKVRFDDILIDTEYRVHDGRVDVITKGLENWLDEQYQQFIDPYYVNGTIDSAWVDTVNGVAWVTVDGVDQQFTFDPPHYPIIVNDENGNQYTIYPDGTIEVGTFLAISETWDVMPDEVIHFGQNESELRGFDPKEHIQWHENYEVMMLGDSSKYFVANKSLAKDEGDKVNVEIPAGVNVSFEFADGTPVMASSLQGNWIGTPQHSGSTKMTLSIPARSSSGNYSIYAFANNQKVGQLNVKVYSKKERELVVVPIATTNLTASQIKAELDNTLGEANLDVDVEITPQWTDNTGTYTASTNISLPTEVGLLNKYSDDMRAIRDLYFDQNPNAPKNKYYLFIVNGFDNPSVLGYMVRGHAMGFVKASQPNILQTISHELGHGMGALEHTFKHNSFEKGDTENLMDYSANPTNLTKAQWKELRDFDLAPSLWDAAEDAASYSVGIAALQPLMDSTNTFTFLRCNGQFITLPSDIKSVTFSTLNRTIDALTKVDQFQELVAPVGTIIGFKDGSNKNYLSSGNGVFSQWDGSWGEPYYGDTLTELYQPTSAISSMFHPVGGQIYEEYFKVNSPISQTSYDLPPADALDKIFIFESENSDRSVDVYDFILNNSITSVQSISIPSTNFSFSNDVENSPIIITNGDSTTLLSFTSEQLFTLLADELLPLNSWIHYLVIASLKENDYQGVTSCVDMQVQNILNQQANEPNEQTILLEQTTTPSSTIIPITELKTAFINTEIFDGTSLSEIADARAELTENVIGNAVQQAYLVNSPTEIAALKATINTGTSQEVANKINFLPECMLYSLTSAERLIAFDKLSDDSYWHLIPPILRNIPENEQSAQEFAIANGFRTNNYHRLRYLVPQTSEWLDLSDQEEVSLLSDILEIFTLYSQRHRDQFPESTTSETLSFVSSVPAWQIPFVYEMELPHIAIPITVGVEGVADVDLGMIKDMELQSNSGNVFHIKTGSSHPKFPLRLKSNGKIEVIQNFKFTEGTMWQSIEPHYSYGNPVNDDNIYEINTTYEIDPMDIVDIVIGAEYGVAGYDKGEILRVPAMTALLIQQNIENADFNREVREFINAIEVGTGIVAVVSAPFTGGASLMTYIEVTAGIAGTIDQMMLQQEYSMSTQELADAEYLEDWKKIKIAVDLTLAGTGIANMSWSSVVGSSSSFGGGTMGLISYGKTLRGSRHFSVALSIRRSLRLTNTADDFTSPYLIQQSQAIRNSFRTGNAIASSTTSGVTGVAAVDAFLAQSPKIDLISVGDLPSGYTISTINNSKYIRRLNASNPNTPRLMVNHEGTVVMYTKPQRLASNNLLRSRLIADNGGVAPPNHQAHHVVPDNVAQNSPIHQEAISRGLYDVDRLSNGKLLAETDEDYITGFYSEAYPTHFGSHPNYDDAIRSQIDDLIETNNIDIFGLEFLTDTELLNILDAIENRALSVLSNWQPSKLN